MSNNIVEVVRVDITSESNFPSVVDLNTLLVITNDSGDIEFPVSSGLYIYEDTDSMFNDGWPSSSFAYGAVSGVFRQEKKAKRVAVLLIDSNETYVEALIRIQEEFTDFLFVITDSTDDIEILEMADYVETSSRYYGVSTNDEAILNNDDGNLAAQIVDLNYSHTFFFFNDSNNVTLTPPINTDGNPEAPMLLSNATNVVPIANLIGRFAPEQAGSITWYMKTIVGITANKFTATQRKNLRDLNCIWYSTVGGIDVVQGEAKVMSGEYIDVELGKAWMRSDLQSRIFTMYYVNNKVNMDGGGVSQHEVEVRNMLQAAIERKIIAADPAPIVKVPNILGFTPAQRFTRNLPDVTFRARLAGAIHTTDIIGSVYP